MEPNHEQLTDEQYMEFTKRFADGEQNIAIDRDGVIFQQTAKSYYWQQKKKIGY